MTCQHEVTCRHGVTCVHGSEFRYMQNGGNHGDSCGYHGNDGNQVDSCGYYGNGGYGHIRPGKEHDYVNLGEHDHQTLARTAAAMTSV